MDVNGTKFHLLLGREDWASCSVAGRPLSELWEEETANNLASPSPAQSPHLLSWNAERDELTLQPRLFRFVAAPHDARPDLKNRRGAARDRFGNWYWIDETGFKIRSLSSGTGAASEFWPATRKSCQPPISHGTFQPSEPALEARPPLPLSGLSITEDHYLVVGTSLPAGLLVFDLYASGEPRHLLWPAEVLFAPYDMSPRPGGGVFILDKENQCYWALDRHFRVLGKPDEETLLADERVDDFQPSDESGERKLARRTFPRGLTLKSASPITMRQPIAIEALPDGSVLILDHNPDEKFAAVHRYCCDSKLDELRTDKLLNQIEAEQQASFSLLGYDLAFVAGDEKEGTLDRLYIASSEGNQAFAFNLLPKDEPPASPPADEPASPSDCVNKRFELHPVAEYFPMRLFGGKGIVAAGGQVHYDFAERWLPLVKQHRPRFVSEATLVTRYFDGKEPQCAWHRLLLDACIQPETKVEVWSRAADEEDDLEQARWQREPQFYLRGDGSEIPFARRRSSERNGGSAQKPQIGDGTWELLLQGARGRWLQLKLILQSNGRMTPRLRALRVYYPRFSYLTNYLPDIYREDEQSASFLDRFLANFEGFYTAIEGRIAAAQMLFDVRSASAEALDWLASWFGVALDPAWDEAKRRLFIKHAVEVFQYRGTMRGLQLALRLALDPCADEGIFTEPFAAGGRAHNIRIVEKYLTRRTPGVVFGDPTEQTGPRLTLTTTRWRPDQGGDNLRQRYADFRQAKDQARQGLPLSTNAGLLQSSSLVQGLAPFPFVRPTDGAEAALWEEFSREALGFVLSNAGGNERALWQNFLRGRYNTINALNAAQETDYQDFAQIALPQDWPANETLRRDWQEFLNNTGSASAAWFRHVWQNFLARRYRRVNAVNELYNTHWPDFETVSLFDSMPQDGAPLTDWYQFEAVVLAMHRTAHRFTVLLPVRTDGPVSGLAEQQRLRVELAHRIINMEKPAHAVFEVKFYWNSFRVGEARLGTDSLLDLGSRAPQLQPAMILGQGYVGESHLGREPIQDTPDRYLLGDERLGQSAN